MKTSLTYGAGMMIAGALLTLTLHVLGYWTDPERLGTAMILALVGGILITVVTLVLGTKAAREEVSTSGFTYGQALKAALGIVVVSTVFGLVFNFIYFQFINTNFAETSAQWTQSFMEKMNAPESQIEKAVEDIRTKSTVTKQLINGLIGGLITGAIVALITSAFLRRAPKEELAEPPATA